MQVSSAARYAALTAEWKIRKVYAMDVIEPLYPKAAGVLLRPDFLGQKKTSSKVLHFLCIAPQLCAGTGATFWT